MVWAGRSIGGKTDLVLIECNMTGKVCMEHIILQAVMP